MIVSPATDMAIVAALVSLGVVYWLARRTKGLGGAIWGIPIQLPPEDRVALGDLLRTLTASLTPTPRQEQST